MKCREDSKMVFATEGGRRVFNISDIEILKDALSQAKMGNREKMETIKRLG